MNFDVDGLTQEGILAFPKRSPSPGVVFIHGHKGNAYSSLLVGKKLLDKGFAVFLPSMLGYGNSQGNADYCGPKTISAINKGIELFCADPRIDKHKLAIYGVSRGAMTAAQIITQNNLQFRAAILEAGAYDFELFYKDKNTPPGVKKKLMDETGATAPELAARSAICNVMNISAPVLILHGEKDEVVNINQAKLLAQSLKKYNKEYEMKIIENAGHMLAKKGRYKYVSDFLNRQFNRK